MILKNYIRKSKSSNGNREWNECTLTNFYEWLKER